MASRLDQALAKQQIAQEKKWQAQSDANTLLNATKIQMDKSRAQAAQAELRRIAQEAQAAAGRSGGSKKRGR